MAKKPETKPVLERTYNVPLRKEWLKSPRYRRSKKAVTALKEFIVKHMKASNIKIGKHLNEEVWKHGIKNPPHHIKVNAVKDSEGLVKVELFGKPIEEVAKKPEVKEKPKKAEEKPKKEEKKTEEMPKKEEKKSEEKPKSQESKIPEKLEKSKISPTEEKAKEEPVKAEKEPEKKQEEVKK